nr:helix-turn-helix transcriptional regulator [uncultured Anaerostipes sp.]
MDKPVKEIKDRLRLALSKRDVSPKELSDKTGIPKSSISQYMSGYTKPKQDRIFLICKALNINEAWLLGYDVPMDGEIVAKSEYEPSLNKRDERDIAKRLEQTLNDLEQNQDGLMFSGEPLDDETKELLKASLENSIRIAKINAKQKFTPKKYRKDE